MIRHIVHLKFGPAISAADADRLLQSVYALKDTIPGILHASGGANNSPEPLAKGYTHSFALDFVDSDARDAYLPHPAHVQVGDALVAAATGGLEGILVFDYAL